MKFSRPFQGIDIPIHSWPQADFPDYKYPLSENETYNRKEDDRCLDMVKDIIESQKKKGIPVAGIIVEPIQCEGGDRHASDYFFQVTN